jgi:hypothetical protein
MPASVREPWSLRRGFIVVSNAAVAVGPLTGLKVWLADGTRLAASVCTGASALAPVSNVGPCRCSLTFVAVCDAITRALGHVHLGAERGTVSTHSGRASAVAVAILSRAVAVALERTVLAVAALTVLAASNRNRRLGCRGGCAAVLGAGCCYTLLGVDHALLPRLAGVILAGVDALANLAAVLVHLQAYCASDVAGRYFALCPG